MKPILQIAMNSLMICLTEKRARGHILKSDYCLHVFFHRKCVMVD